MVNVLPRVLSVALGAALALGVALVQPPVAEAAPASTSASARQKFIAGLVSVAQDTQRKFGVPASVSIAEAIEASKWGTSTEVSKARNYFDTRCSASMTASQFAKLAEAQVGKRYVLGALALSSNPDPAKFDCSELVKWLFARSGNKITDLAASQYDVTKKVKGSPKVGDLVFLRNNPARANGIGHVAVLTKKKSDGDWEIVEARGHAAGVVKTTLSYWKTRSYYAGLRRYPKFVLANGDGVAASAAKTYQVSCVTIGGTRYATFGSKTDSFYANAAAITRDSAYKKARAAMASIPKFVDELAKVVKPKAATAYAADLKNLIAGYHLTDYDIVPIKIVLDSGKKGFRVTALQYLLKAAGYGTRITGAYDAGTVAKVKKFQKSKKLEADGEAGQNTLTALFKTVKSGTTGPGSAGLNAVLGGLGYTTTSGDQFGAATLAALKSFQTGAGRGATGTADANTWAALFMSLDSERPKVTGTAKVGRSLAVDAGDWGPGQVALAYQWYRGTTAISGATSASYTAQPGDAGSTLTVRVTGSRAGYTVTTRTSAATSAVARADFSTTPAPTVSGSARVGGVLTAHVDGWKPAPASVVYQWYRGGAAIKGATKATYTAQAADAGAKLSVAATVARPGYNSVTKRSPATKAVAKGTLSPKTPTISGTSHVGRKLKAEPGDWSPAGVHFTYRWYRDSHAIKGATKSTYKLTKSDKGTRLTVVVTGSKAGYETVAKQSAKTGKVTE
jgi:peptidoglycan hydrolase-like protein with peptidoglycan-binding domain